MSRLQATSRIATASLPALRLQSKSGITHPADITGMVAHYRSGSLTDADGAKVPLWNDDFAGRNNALQGTASKQPDIIYNVLNGYPVVRLVQASLDHWISTAAVTVQTMVAVVKLNTSTFPASDAVIGGGGIEGIHGGTGTTSYKVVGGLPLYINANQSTANYDTGDASQWHIVIGVYSTPQSFPTIQIAKERTNGNYWDGDYAEFILYDRSVSESDRTSIAAYLKDKYAIGYAI